MAESENVTMVADAPATTKRSADPWKKKVTIKLPKAARGQDNFVIASVNGRVYKIKKGEEVEVPAPIAEVIQNAEMMRDEADSFVEEQVEKHEKKEQSL